MIYLFLFNFLVDKGFHQAVGMGAGGIPKLTNNYLRECFINRPYLGCVALNIKRLILSRIRSVSRKMAVPTYAAHS